MAIYRIATDDSGRCSLELSREEYEVIKRALAKALVRAREICASKDEDDLVRLLSNLEPEVFSLPSAYLIDR